MTVAQARAIILAKSTTNADLIRATTKHEIQIDGSGNILAPQNGVFVVLSNQSIIEFAEALQTSGA